MIAFATADEIRAAAYFVISIAVLVGAIGVYRMHDRLNHMSADIKGVKLEVDAKAPDSMKSKLEKLTTTVVEEVKPALDEFGKSVNNVPAGSPTLVQRVVGVEVQNAELRVEFGEFRDEVRTGQQTIIRRLDGLERAARQTAQFQSELVAKIGLEIARGGEKETPT